MSKKFLPVLVVLCLAGLFIALTTQGRMKNDDNPKARYKKVLHNVGLLLEEGHYSPQKINDSFSVKVLRKFEDELDGEKDIFLQSDINLFSKYATVIDDEIHGTELESFFTISDLYLKRLNEASGLYKEILSRPMEFKKDESIQLNGEMNAYPRNEADRKDTWRKRMKYMVLSRYSDMKDEQEKSKKTKDFKFKADTTMEREARDQVFKQMDRYFNNKKNRETTDENFSIFVNAITNMMDPHSDYFPPIDLRSFNEQMSGRFYGIGAQLKEEDGKIKIASLVGGGPAWKSGELKENDEILKVAQGNQLPVDVTGFAVTDAVKLIRGSEKSSEVRLTVKKIDGSIKIISLIRDEIKLEDTFAKSAIINGQHKIGYIYLPEFYADFERPGGARCAVDVAKEIGKLKAEQVEGIVLDLRNNGGGSLADVVQMAGLFIEDGPICQVKGRDEKASVLRDKDKNILYTGPLAVMVDETSASASEIFAAAIQDYKRGIIIGSTSTYGKGTVQRNIPLNPESENSFFSSNKKVEDLGTVKLTLQKFYRINGGATQLKGVTPDIVLPDRLEYLKIREKDVPSALKWDEISKADYKPWESNYSTESVVAKANLDISENPSFGQIRKDIQWLGEENDKEISLNFDKYRSYKKTVTAIYTRLDSLIKLKEPLPIINTAADTGRLAGDKDRTEKNKQWIKRISADIYIDETVKVIYNMINQAGLAKVN